MGPAKRNQLLGKIVNAVGVFLAAYVVSYVALTRWSLHCWSSTGLLGCYLLPINPCITAESPALELCEMGLRLFYYPLQLIDLGLTGTGYGGIPMMRLSG